MEGLATQRQKKIREQKEELRTLALSAKDYMDFTEATSQLVDSIDVFDLMEEFRSQGAESLGTYYKNIRGE
ncbi:MAG: hypothetical protein AB7E76_02685 [Deferribacterales bacterium]